MALAKIELDLSWFLRDRVGKRSKPTRPDPVHFARTEPTRPGEPTTSETADPTRPDDPINPPRRDPPTLFVGGDLPTLFMSLGKTGCKPIEKNSEMRWDLRSINFTSNLVHVIMHDNRLRHITWTGFECANFFLIFWNPRSLIHIRDDSVCCTCDCIVLHSYREHWIANCHFKHYFLQLFKRWKI